MFAQKKIQLNLAWVLTLLNTDTTKLSLYTRVPVTVEIEPPSG